MNLLISTGLQRSMPFVLLLLMGTAFTLWPYITGTLVTTVCIVLLGLMCLARLGIEVNLPTCLSFNVDGTPKQIQRLDFQTIVNDLPVGVAIWPMHADVQETVDSDSVYVNPLFLHHIGAEKHSEPKFHYDMFCSEDTKATDQMRFSEAKKTGRLGPYERLTTKPNGEQVSLRIHGQVFEFEGQQYWLLTTEDISDIREVEQALVKARIKAEGSARIKSEFLANMSHEIRTPMNGIIGMAELCLKTDLSTSQKNYLNKIGASGRSLLAVINDILDFSKIESGKMDIVKEAFLFSDLTSDLANKVALLAEKKEINLYFKIDASVPQVLIGDRNRIGQVLTNLTNNAIKFTPKSGEIVVEVKLQQRAGRRLLLLFSVKDSGIGISRDNQTKLFRDFSQLNQSNNADEMGTGLGLSISKNLVELMDGNIWVESDLGSGSTFSFTAELLYDEERSAHYEQNRQAIETKRILVCDGLATSRTLIEEILESFGCIVSHIRSDDLSAFLQTAETPFDLILVDIENEYLQQQLLSLTDKQSSVYTSVPVVGISSLASKHNKVRHVLENSLAAIIARPLTASTLLETLSDVMDVELLRPFDSGLEQSSATHEADLKGARLLLAEDNEINQEVIVEMLHTVGIEVDVAVNGLQAVNLAQENDYDGILMDCQMPVMDGYTATQQIRGITKLERLPIIALTANVMAADRAKALECGMNDHIAKPIDLNAMLTTLAQWIKPKSTGESVIQRVPDTQDSFPDLRGFDREKAIAITRGNAKLFIRMLRRFSDQYRDFNAVTFEEYSIAEWGNRAHALKGVSAHLGATVLHGHAAALESAARNGEDPHAAYILMNRELALLITVIDEFFSENAKGKEKPRVIDVSNTEAWFSEIHQMIELGNIDVKDQLESLRALCVTEQQIDIYRRLEVALNTYDFANATAQLYQLEHLL